MKAVILCGGKATRLGNLTLDTPKGMLLINGKPILERQIEYLKGQGITVVILAVGHLSDKILQYFGDGSKFGISIKYSFDKSQGTGGALRNAKSLLNETFILMNGDTVFDANIHEMLITHNKGNRLLTIGYDIHSISIGLYVVDRRLLDIIPEGTCSLENDIVSLVKVTFFPYRSKWYDIGTEESYEQYR